MSNGFVSLTDDRTSCNYCAIPSVVQNSTAAEMAVTGTVLDTSRSRIGSVLYFCRESGGAHGITVYLQSSMDGQNWKPGSVSGISAVIAPGATMPLSNFSGGVNFLPRFLQLSVVDTVSGSHGTLTVDGGFAK